MIKYVLSVLLALVSSQAFAGEVRVSDFDGGGEIGTYKVWYDRWYKSEDTLVIDAPCLSACTLFLAYPTDRVCVTSRGSLGFHQAANQDGPQAILTQILVRAWYPEWVQKWIVDKGGLTADIIPMWPEEMQPHIAMCNGEAVPTIPADGLIKKEEVQEPLKVETEGNRQIITPQEDKK